MKDATFTKVVNIISKHWLSLVLVDIYKLIKNGYLAIKVLYHCYNNTSFIVIKLIKKYNIRVSMASR